MDTVKYLVGDREIVFEILSPKAKERAGHLFTKEPNTISWIDQFMPGETFWDIGANIGSFSLYAAARGCEVYAFEPAAANYYALNSNIIASGLDKTITALPIAVADASRFDRMRMRNNEIGGALHVFGSDIDFAGKPFKAAWMQGAISHSIDGLCAFGVPFPHHVKIDVDSIEAAIVRGGAATLGQAEFKSVLVEVHGDDHEEISQIDDMMKAAGLTQDLGIADNQMRRSKKTYNLIYRRM